VYVMCVLYGGEAGGCGMIVFTHRFRIREYGAIRSFTGFFRSATTAPPSHRHTHSLSLLHMLSLLHTQPPSPLFHTYSPSHTHTLSLSLSPLQPQHRLGLTDADLRGVAVVAPGAGGAGAGGGDAAAVSESFSR
jgi:hypothetical protein